MNNRIRLSKTLILLIMFLGVVVFGVLSCAQTLPVQQEISVYIYAYDENNPSSSGWVDYDIQNGTGKIVAFPGTRFSRLITPHEFTVETESYRKLYSFDGKTYSLSNKLGEQVPFYGTFTASQKPVLYAYYEERSIQKEPIELLGDVVLTKYVAIPTKDSLGTKDNNPKIDVKLNGSYTFKPDKFHKGRSIPNDWTLTKVKGVNYIQGDLEENNTRLVIYLSGTPYSSQEEVSNIKFEIPSTYVNDASGVLDSFKILPGDAKNWTTFTINQAPFSMKDTTISMEEYTALNTTIEIKADNVPVLRDSSGITKQEASAKFNPDVLKPGTVIVDAENKAMPGWKIEPPIAGITYTVKSLDTYGTTLTLAVEGIPIVKGDDDWTNAKSIKITMPENVILGASSASPEITDEDVIVVDTARSFVRMDKMEIAVDENTTVRAIKGITIPEASAEEVRITITSGATFNRNMIEIGSEIPLDTTSGYTETSKWKFPTRDGLKYTFGALSNNDRTLTIKIYGTLKDASPYTAGKDDIEIPQNYFDGGSFDSASNTTIKRMSVSNDENIIWDYASVSATISKDGSDSNHAIKGINNVVFNSGDGANVEIRLLNAKFKAGLTGERIASWFKEFENNFGGNGSFVYKAIGGASGDTSSPYVLVNISGVSQLAEKISPTEVKISIPYSDIEDATSDFGAVEASIWYENDTLKLSLGAGYGRSDNPLNADRESQLIDPEQAIPGQSVQFVLENGQFDISEISSDTLSLWFDALKEAFGKDLKFSYTSLSADKDKLIVKVTGVPTSTNEDPQSATIKVPVSAIRGAKATATFEYISVQVYYQSSTISALLVPGENLYGTVNNDQRFNNPISGIRYTPLSSSVGEYQTIRVQLRGGKFISSLNDDSVSRWFASWDGISSSSYRVISMSSDRTSVDVAIAGVLTGEIADASECSVFYIRIPSTDIENPDFSKTISVPLRYYTKGGISIKLGDRSVGTSTAPIKGIRYVSLGDDGVDLSVRIEDGEFDIEKINNSVVSGWFRNFNDNNIIIRPIYTIKEKTNSHITINIKGAISAPVSNVARSFPLIINKEAIKGEFVEDIKDVSVYYQTIDVVKAEFDNQNKDKYYGSLENPIEAISLAQINSGNGILVKINLIGGGETEGVSGPRFVSGLNNQDVSHWFDLCKDHITNASYTIEEGGKGKNYAVVRIKGGFTTAKSDDEDPIVLSVNIRSSDIEGFLPDDVGVKNGFAYKITSEISADLDPSIVYKGSVEHPIVGTNGVSLNNDEGYPVRVRLSGSVFSSSINIGKDVASWFNAFTDLSESEITITEMSGRRDAITILVKGVLIKDTDDVERVFINIPPDAIEGYLTSTVQVELFYQIEDKISASFTDGEGSSYYFGTVNNPFSTVQYIPRTLQLRVELNNAVFADISSSSVSKWFEAFNENISSPSYRFIQGGKDTNYAIIEVTGALKTDNLENQNITLSIPNSDIKDSYISTGIPLELTYCISDKVSAAVSEEGSSNYGSIANPFTGTRHIKVGDTTLDGGKLIRIQLKNAKFVKNLSSNANISSWFKNWTTFTNAEFSIAGGGRGESFIIIRAKGILTDEVSRESRSVNIEIDKNAIDGYLIEDLKTPLYYKTTAEVEAVATVIDSVDNVIHGTYGVRLNNGDGVLVRVELKNGAVFGKDVTPPDFEGNEGADVSHWFSSLRRVSAITTPNVEDESYIVEEGGAGQNYVIVRVKGAYISTVSTTPNSYPLDIVASSTKVGDTYKEDGIYGALPSAVKADLKFVNDKYVSASFVESAGYYGSETYPIDGASYVALGGGDAGLIVSIKLTDGVVFSNKKEENEFNEGVANWFKTWTDAVLISGSERFEVINGGRGKNFITIRINGQLNISTVDIMSTNISISYDDIDGFLTSNVITPLYYKASKKVTVSLDSGSEYKGSASYPIAEKNYIKFGDGNGVFLRLNFVNGTINTDNTDQVSVNKTVTSWFSSMLATSSGGDGLHDASFVIERVTEDKKSIIIKATGWLLTDSLKGVPSEVVVPSTVIDGSLPQDLTTTAYYCKTNDVKAYASTSEGFYGSGDNPIQGTRYVAITDARGNKGQDVKIYLNGGKFSRAYLDSIKDDETTALKNGWFKGLDAFMSNATYELSYEGKGDHSSKVDPSEITVHIEGALINSTESPKSDGSYHEQNFDVEILSNQIANYGSGDSTIVCSVPLKFEITGIVGATIGSEVDNNYGGKNNPISGVKYVPLNNGSGVKLHIELNNANFKVKPTSEELETIWFEAFRSLVDDSDNDDEKYTCVGGGVDLDNVGNIDKQYNYVDILIKGALNVDRLDEPYQVNVVIPNDAIDWNTGDDKTNLNIRLYYNTTGEVTAKLDTTGLYRGGSSGTSLEGIKYIPMNNTQGYDVKISLDGTSFRWTMEDIDRDIRNWFVNFTEIRNVTYTVRPLPNDKSYVVVNIKGSLISDPGSAKTVKVIIPKEAIKAELNADVQLDLYYNTTDVVSAEVSANGVDFVGSETNPIKDIQYLPLGEGAGVQVRITLHNATFNVSKDTNVSTWFSNFRELTNGSNEDNKFTVVDGSVGSNVVVVQIKGALTSRKEDELKSINIQIQPEHINGDFDSPITTTLYYKTTDVVSAKLATEYDGTNADPIKGVKYIDIGNGSGTTIRIDLENGAKFSRDLTSSDMETLFANFNSVLISPVSSAPKYSITSGGREGDTYLIININGALTSTNTNKQSVDLVIPTNCIAAFLPSNAPIKVPLYYKTFAKVVTKFDNNNTFYYGSEDNPLQETRYIKFQSTSGEEKAQVYLKLTNAIFSDTLNVDNVKEWFSSWENIIGEHQNGVGVDDKGVRYTIDGGGQGMDYVIIGISGALTLQTAGKTIYTLIIPASNIKGAHEEGLVEEITADLYYQSASEVEFEILEGEYTESNLTYKYVGSSSNQLRLVQNISVGNGKGEKIQISIQNAKFVSNDDNVWSSLLTKMFDEVETSFPQLNFEFDNLSPNRDTLTIKVSGYHSGSSNPESQTIRLIITKDMIDKACVGRPIGDDSDYDGRDKFRAPSIVIHNPSETYISLELVRSSIGTINNPIQTYPNTPISEKIGEGSSEVTSVGVNLTFELTNGATFSDACTAQNLSAWFTAINAELGSDLQYVYVASEGTGSGTNKLIVRVSGQTTSTKLGTGAANAIVNGNFIEGARDDFRRGNNAFSVPIYWNVNSTPGSAT